MTATEHYRPMHESANGDFWYTSVGAIMAVRFRPTKPGYRWVVWACPVCQCWHVEQIRGVM